MKSPKKKNNCPCESGKAYTICCQPIHLSKSAPNAEKLMRSRYSAYVLGLKQYLLDTWHPAHRPSKLDLNEEGECKWLGLSIKHVEESSSTSATVEFIACFRLGGGKAERMHEVSEFELLDRWYYVTGKFPD